jgi:threonine/homoserine/homoserine lactone efflux protein
MSNVTPYLGFLTVSLMIALSPGPSWAYTISTTLGHGKKCGMIGNLGNSAGILCHALAVVLGLAAVLQYSAATFHALKILGVAYLIYLALQAFRNGAVVGQVNQAPRASTWTIFRNGVFASLFNPKISLLMLALLPQFVSPGASNPELQIAAMGAMHALVAGIVHSHLVFFSGSLSRRLKKSGKAQRAIRWATGTVFLGFGARLAAAER